MKLSPVVHNNIFEQSYRNLTILASLSKHAGTTIIVYIYRAHISTKKYSRRQQESDDNEPSNNEELNKSYSHQMSFKLILKDTGHYW